MSEEFLGCVPLTWKNMLFWGLPPARAVSLARIDYAGYCTLPTPTKSHWYRLTPQEAGWRLEACPYGDGPALCLSDLTPLANAELPELLACMGVLTREGATPQILTEPDSVACRRLQARWRSWVKTPPSWLSEIQEAPGEKETRS